MTYRRGLTRRVAGLAAVSVTAAVLAGLTLHSRAAMQDSPATLTPGTPKPTIVLVHGAFADASRLGEVTRRLQRDGYTVLVPANPLRGIAADTSYLRSVLDTVSGPVVLVGHSYAGALISNVAAGDSRVKALVLVAAFLPEVDEPLGRANAGSKDVLLGPDAQEVREYAAAGGGTGKEATVKTDRFRQIMGADLSAERAGVLAASQRPVDVRAFGEPATQAAWRTIPSWCLIPTDDRAIGADAERAMAARANCHTVAVSGSRLVMVVKPDAVSALIEEAATATSR